MFPEVHNFLLGNVNLSTEDTKICLLRKGTLVCWGYLNLYVWGYLNFSFEDI